MILFVKISLRSGNLKLFFPILCAPILLYSYTLNELLELSHKNRVMESASHALISKEKNYESVKSSYLPKIEVGGVYQNTYEDSAMVAENSIKAYGDLKYTIYDGGKRENTYSKLRYLVDAGKSDLESLKQTLSLDVTRLYFEYLSLESDKIATNQEIEQLQAELTRLQHFYKSGSVTKDELDKIDSRLKSALVLLQEIELSSQKVLHTLEYYTTKEIQKIEAGATIEPKEGSIAIRADIKALEQSAESMLYDAKSKQSQNLPTLSFSNTLSYTDYYFDDNSLKSAFLIDTQNIAMLQLSWNAFDFGAVTKEYESKFHDYLSKKASLEHEKHKAAVELKLAKKSLEIAKQKIDSSKAALDATDATYELVKLKYQNKTIDNVAYLEALSEKYDAARVYERAIWDHEVKKAELIYHSGKDIADFTNSKNN